MTVLIKFALLALLACEPAHGGKHGAGDPAAGSDDGNTDWSGGEGKFDCTGCTWYDASEGQGLAWREGACLSKADAEAASWDPGQIAAWWKDGNEGCMGDNDSGPFSCYAEKSSTDVCGIQSGGGDVGGGGGGPACKDANCCGAGTVYRNGGCEASYGGCMTACSAGGVGDVFECARYRYDPAADGDCAAGGGGDPDCESAEAADCGTRCTACIPCTTGSTDAMCSDGTCTGCDVCVKYISCAGGNGDAGNSGSEGMGGNADSAGGNLPSTGNSGSEGMGGNADSSGNFPSTGNTGSEGTDGNADSSGNVDSSGMLRRRR